MNDCIVFQLTPNGLAVDKPTSHNRIARAFQQGVISAVQRDEAKRVLHRLDRTALHASRRLRKCLQSQHEAGPASRKRPSGSGAASSTRAETDVWCDVNLRLVALVEALALAEESPDDFKQPVAAGSETRNTEKG